MREETIFWFAILGGLGSLASIGQFIYALLSYHRRMNVHPQDSAVSVEPKFPYVRMLFFLLLTWGAVVFNYYDRHYAQPASDRFYRLLSEWGAGNNECHVKLDASRILDFSKQYDVAFVCGIENPSVDTLSETLISISNPYYIVSSQISMLAPMRKAMIEDLDQRPKGHMWYYVILIPKGIDVGIIRQLADVKRYGGKILHKKYFEE